MQRMRCPTCGVAMIDNDRLGVKTGYCPECDGEWFARGAVDRLLDRAARPRPPEPTSGDEQPAAVPSAIAAPDERPEGTWHWF